MSNIHLKLQGVPSAVDWATVPRLVHPMGGNLPEKRLVKKCQQLESMAAEVVKIAAGNKGFLSALQRKIESDRNPVSA